MFLDALERIALPMADILVKHKHTTIEYKPPDPPPPPLDPPKPSRLMLFFSGLAIGQVVGIMIQIVFPVIPGIVTFVINYLFW